MDENEWLADRFEEHRAHLRAVAYRMLGSVTEAEEAVQDTWLRLSRSGRRRGGEPRRLADHHRRARLPERPAGPEGASRADRRPAHARPGGEPRGQCHPEEESLLADSVGLALLVVLDTLSPAERLAFVLHDMFELPFEEIAPMVGRTAAAARQLASRARRRVKGAAVPPRTRSRPSARGRRRFFAAAAGAIRGPRRALDPDVVRRTDAGELRRSLHGLHGADAVARQALTGLSSALPMSLCAPP